MKKLNHIGIAVPDLNAAIAFYRDVLNLPVSATLRQEDQGVIMVFVTLENTTLELLSVDPEATHCPIQSFLVKNPAGGIHHICLETEHFEEDIKQTQAQGIRTTGPATTGACGHLIQFLHPKDCLGTLIELQQR